MNLSWFIYINFRDHQNLLICNRYNAKTVFYNFWPPNSGPFKIQWAPKWDPKSTKRHKISERYRCERPLGASSMSGHDLLMHFDELLANFWYPFATPWSHVSRVLKKLGTWKSPFERSQPDSASTLVNSGPPNSQLSPPSSQLLKP